MSGELQRLAPIAVPAPLAPVFPAEPLERLPLIAGETDPYWRLVTAFLVGYPPHSSRAYFSDLKDWYAWCAQLSVHPLAVRRHHVDASWATARCSYAASPKSRTGSASTGPAEWNQAVLINM